MNAVWEKRNSSEKTSYVRAMIGSEAILDQVHQLKNGHDQFAFGITFSSQLTYYELKSRLLKAIVRLRYTCPIFSAIPTQNIHDPELRSWVYTPIESIQQAKQWAVTKLHTHINVAQSNPELELCNLVERPLAAQDVFEVHLSGPYVNGQYTLFVYASHVIVEGQAMIALVNQLLAWTTEKDLKVEEELHTEDSQVRNLDPGAVVMFGGLPEGWDEESRAFLKKLASSFQIEKPSHSLKPQRMNITTLGKIVRAHRSLDEQTTFQLLKGIKAHGLTVTQVLEAAHAIAVYTLEPLPPSEMARSHISIYPALISTRHLRVPPYDRPDGFGNLNSGFTLLFPSELVNFPPQTSLHTRVLTLARSSQAQYRAFMSFPYHQFTFPAQAEAHPLRGPLGEDPNKYLGEITSLGVLDKKVGLNWYGGESEEKPLIAVKDVHLGLRQCIKQTMVHSWTLRGQLKLQIQASDVWDVGYLEAFLDEIIKGAYSVCEFD